MNALTLRRLVGVLAALVAVWLALRLARHAARDTEQHLAPARYDPGAVDRALVVHAADTLRFVRRAHGAWDVNGWAADASLVDALAAALADTAATSELVAVNPSSHRALGLDSADARRITLYQGPRAVAALLVGHPGQAYEQVYVRRPGQAAAFAVGGRLSDLASRSLDEWRNRRIAGVAPESIAAVEVQRSGRSWRLERAGDRWRLGTVDADSAAVATLLRRYGDVEAVGFGTTAQADSSRPRARRSVRLLAGGGRTLFALTLDSTGTGFWTRREGDSTVYRVDAYAADGLAPADSTLRKKK